MSTPAKIRYEIELDRAVAPEAAEGTTVRTVGPADGEALAELMLDAYKGTIDYDGETLDDARDEVNSWFSGTSPLFKHSFCALVDGETASAVLVSELEGAPFIGYVMTKAAHKRHGLARLVTRTALDSLAHAGYERVVFYITDGNVESEALFANLGAHAVPAP